MQIELAFCRENGGLLEASHKWKIQRRRVAIMRNKRKVWGRVVKIH